MNLTRIVEGLEKRPRPFLLLLACLFACVLPAHAQLATSFLTVTGIKVIRLRNAVQVRIETDGSPKFGTDLRDFVDFDAGFAPKPTQSLRIRIVGARARLPGFVPIDAYPFDGAIITPGRSDFQNPFFSNGAYAQPEPRVDIELRFATPVVAQQFAVNPGDDGIRFGQYADPLEFKVEPSRDGRAIVITVIPDRSDLNGAAALDRSPVESRNHGLTFGKRKDGTFRVLALHAPLRQVLVGAAQVSGIAFAARPDVADLDVTLNLPNATPKALLEALQTGYNVGALVENDGIVVGRGDEFLQAQRFALNNLAPDATRLLFPDFLLPYLRPDRQNNAIVATGTPAVLRRVAADLKKLDQPRAQFEIEAQIWELSATRDVNYALQLTRSVGRDRQTFDFASGQTSVTVQSGQTDQLQARLDALVSRGRGRLRAAPRVTVVAGERGSIFLGQTRYVLVLQQRGRQQVSQALPLQIGAQLDVTPRGDLAPGDPIALDIAPRVSTVDALESGTGLPTIGLREITSSLVIDATQSVIVAGLSADLDFETTGTSLKIVPSRRASRTAQQLIVLIKARRVIAQNPAPKIARANLGTGLGASLAQSAGNIE